MDLASPTTLGPAGIWHRRPASPTPGALLRSKHPPRRSLKARPRHAAHPRCLVTGGRACEPYCIQYKGEAMRIFFSLVQGMVERRQSITTSLWELSYDVCIARCRQLHMRQAFAVPCLDRKPEHAAEADWRKRSCESVLHCKREGHRPPTPSPPPPTPPPRHFRRRARRPAAASPPS